MLFAWKGATVFQAGPSIAMNWYDTNGTGNHVAAGNRTGDSDAMCGNAVMYDATAGQILVVGGSSNYVFTPLLHPRHLLLTSPVTSKTPPQLQTPTSSPSASPSRNPTSKPSPQCPTPASSPTLSSSPPARSS